MDRLATAFPWQKPQNEGKVRHDIEREIFLTMTIIEKISEKFDCLMALIGHTPRWQFLCFYKGEPRLVRANA